MEGIRINKLLSGAGICSRRNADDIILQGRVKINGEVVTELGTKIKAKDEVQVDGKVISLALRKIYIMLNKPKGYITTSKEQFNRPCVLDLLDTTDRVFSVGRLDMDSEGLLLLTNDGDFANKIIHPSKHVAKKYEVVLRENISCEQIKKLENGIDIGGYITAPAKVVKVKDNVILLTIQEGKNRQIRKMCEAIENKVINLKRLSIGNLELGALKAGQYIYLNEKQINKIFE